MKGIQFQIGLDERLLNDIFRFVRTADDTDHGCVQTILVTSHQDFEGRAVAGKGGLNQCVFVVHSGLQKIIKKTPTTIHEWWLDKSVLSNVTHTEVRRLGRVCWLAKLDKIRSQYRLQRKKRD